MRFPKIPEALTEGETEEEARTNAGDCVTTAFEGYVKAGRPIPRPSAPSSGRNRAVLPSLVTAKLAVYETMRKRGWSKTRLAKELGVPENSVRRLLDPRHNSQMGIVDAALAKCTPNCPLVCPAPGRAAGQPSN
jgi:antitoxin HicB